MRFGQHAGSDAVTRPEPGGSLARRALRHCLSTDYHAPARARVYQTSYARSAAGGWPVGERRRATLLGAERSRSPTCRKTRQEPGAVGRRRADRPASVEAGEREHALDVVARFADRAACRRSAGPRPRRRCRRRAPSRQLEAIEQRSQVADAGVEVGVRRVGVAHAVLPRRCRHQLHQAAARPSASAPGADTPTRP